MSDQPTERVKRLYHQLHHRWGEATEIRKIGEPTTATGRAFDFIDLAIWDSDETCDITTYFTLGMSERFMKGADYRVELTLGVRDPITANQRTALGLFLANVTEYPFMYDLKLDWWETLADVGAVPVFTECRQALLVPMFGEEPFERFAPPDDDVKVLSLVPITPHEHHLLSSHGRSAFLDHWEREGVDIFQPRRDTVPTA